jgi:hypothetical protein
MALYQNKAIVHPTPPSEGLGATCPVPHLSLLFFRRKNRLGPLPAFTSKLRPSNSASLFNNG